MFFRSSLVTAFLITANAAPVAGQAAYHGPGHKGFALGAVYAHQTGEDVNAFSAEAVGTLHPRFDVSAAYTALRPRFGSDGWTATAVGTVYPVAGPSAWVGLHGGLSRIDAGFSAGTGIVYGVGVAGRLEAGPVVLVPQTSVVGVSELDGRVVGDGSLGFGVALGVVLPTSAAPIVLEPSVSFASAEGFSDDEGFDPGVITVGATLRLLWSRGEG